MLYFFAFLEIVLFVIVNIKLLTLISVKYNMSLPKRKGAYVIFLMSMLHTSDLEYCKNKINELKLIHVTEK